MAMANNATQQRALLLVGVSLGLGILFDFLFFSKLPGISFPLYTLLATGSMLALTKKVRGSVPVSSAALAAPILFFAWMVAVRAGELLTFINIVTTLGLFGLLVVTVFKPNIRKYLLRDYVRMPLELVGYLPGSSRQTFAEAGAVGKLVKEHKSAAQIARGLLITIPVLVLFTLLFASADLIFEKYVTDLFSFHLNDQLVPRFILVALVTAVFAGVFGLLAKKSIHMVSGEPAVTKSQMIGPVEVTILFSSLNILFLSFIALQVRYLFGGQSTITGQGFTYATYARKGFFELIAVAVISFALILVTERLLARQSQKHTKHFKVLAGLLIAQVMVVMASAFNRLSLYESAYGFTSLRLVSHIFIVWLAAVFSILLYKIYKNQKESTFAFALFVSILVWFGMANAVNIEGMVARKNVARYKATGKIDTYYLSKLSEDGLVDSVKLLDTRDREVRDEFARMLYHKRLNVLEKDRHWQSANIARKRARRALGGKQVLLRESYEKSLQESNVDKQ